MNTTTTVPHAINTYYDRNMLAKARPFLTHLKWAYVKPIPRNNTENIRFRRYSLLAVDDQPLVEGVTPSLDQLQVVNVDAKVEQYGRGFLITDKLSFTTVDPLLMEVSDILAQNAANTFDILTRNELSTTTTVQFAGGSATSNSQVTATDKITKAEIQAAVRTLKNNNARKINEAVSPQAGFNTTPVQETYIGIVHPDTTYDLKNIPGFVSIEEYGNIDALEGEVGKLDEVRFIETTNAMVFEGEGDSGIDVYGTLIIAKDFYAVTEISGEGLKNIIEGPGGNNDPLHQRQTSAWKGTFVATILNDAFGLSLRHAVSS